MIAIHATWARLAKVIKWVFPIALILFPIISSASSMEEEFGKKYPADRFIVGIGHSKITKDRNVDDRIAAVIARAEVAKQIRVRINQTFVDISCEGATGKLFDEDATCKNSIVSTIEQTVDEVLVGSSIVKTGTDGGMVYAVVVLPLIASSQKLEESIEDSLQKARESLKSAKKGGGDSFIKARDEYLKANMLSKEKESLDGVRSNAAKALQDMEKELIRLKD